MEGRFDFRRWRLVILGGILVGIVLLSAIFAPFVAPYSPLDLDVVQMLQPPSSAHWLGTDELGRDVLSRILYDIPQDLRIVPVEVVEGACGNVFLCLIERLADRVIVVQGPVGRKNIVGTAAQQHFEFPRDDFADGFMQHIVPVMHEPASVFEIAAGVFFGTAGCLHHTVD